jgi:hypothetical protein
MPRPLLLFWLAGRFLVQDPPEWERLISSLGSESAEHRQKAEDRLIELGPQVLPALRKAAAGSDPEVCARARSAIEDIERVEHERQQDLLEKQRLYDKFRNEPMKKQEEAPGALLTGAARFDFSVKPFQKGLVLSTFPWNYLYLEGRWEDISFDLADVKDQSGRTLELERCGRCSPQWILVKDTAGPLRVHLRGTQLWFSTYAVEFKEPKNGDQRKVGDFSIRVDWPLLKVSCRKSWPKEIMAKVGTSFSVEVKEGLRPPAGAVQGGGRGFGFKSSTSPKWWCHCEGGPVPVVPKPKPELVQKLEVGGGEGYRLDQISSISYTFYKPIEESIDVTTDVPHP